MSSRRVVDLLNQALLCEKASLRMRSVSSVHDGIAGATSGDRTHTMTYPDGRALAYGYDAHGNRTSLTAKVRSPVRGTNGLEDHSSCMT